MMLRQTLDTMAGQTVLITGGAGMIARALAKSLADARCDLCLVDLPATDVRSFARDVSSLYGVRCVGIVADLEMQGDRVSLVEKFRVHFDKLDLLINNAAFVGDTKLAGWTAPFEEQTVETMRRCIEVNLVAAFHLVQIFIDHLRLTSGRVVNIGSIYGMLGPDMRLYEGTPMGNPGAYAASKGGLVQMTRWLATTLAPDVRVNCISLGGVFRSQPEVFVERYLARTPLRRMATEDDVVGAVIYLGFGPSSYVTGHNLVVDGGWSAW